MSQQGLFKGPTPAKGPTTPAEVDAELRSRDDDPTPRGTIAPIIAAAVRRGALRLVWRITRSGTHLESCDRIVDARNPLRVLDVCAGFGSWSSEFARWWVHALGAPREWLHITGVEIHPPRAVDLRKWCDVEIIGDWASIEGDYDLAIGNPAFSLLFPDLPHGFRGEVPEENIEASMPAVLLKHAPAVLLLHTQQAFLRGRAGRAVWRRYTPVRQWLIPGAVRFRVGTNTKTGKPYGSDQRCYCASLWQRAAPRSTMVEMLADLGADDLRWDVEPGSEDPSDDLPAAPRWTR